MDEKLSSDGSADQRPGAQEEGGVIGLLALVGYHLRRLIREPRQIANRLGVLRTVLKTAGPRSAIQLLYRAASRSSDGLLSEDALKQLLLPTPATVNPPTLTQAVLIIVPVYRDCAITARCLDSIMAAANATEWGLLLINDCSPDAGMQHLLQRYCERSDRVSLLENAVNLGFVASVNRGLRLAGGRHVVLLNSDTEVYNNWLDRLVATAFSADDIGTVTPFSNNATICTYPAPRADAREEWACLDGETFSDVDTAFSIANAGAALEIPTAVGFCMFIRANCLAQVGELDSDAFGKGYGEENDFCLRAESLGWRHVLAADTFVYHRGAVSFGDEQSKRVAAALVVVKQRYPDFLARVTDFSLRDPAFPYRLAATAARYAGSGRDVVLLISHDIGGGTEKHIQDVGRQLQSEGARVLTMRPANTRHAAGVKLEPFGHEVEFTVKLPASDPGRLAACLKRFGVNRIQVHHTRGFDFSVRDLLRCLASAYSVTIHDYFCLCPRVNLIAPGRGYCGVGDASACNQCYRDAPQVTGGIECRQWRGDAALLLDGASRVICPSRDTARRISRYFPAASVEVVLHERAVARDPVKPRSRRARALIAILGVLADHKGRQVVKALIDTIVQRKLPLEIVVIGYSIPSLRRRRHVYSETGAYAESELAALIEQVDPDLFVFPAQCPETYSYTLSEALRSGRPIAVPSIGALPERVEGLDHCTIYPFGMPPSELASFLHACVSGALTSSQPRTEE